MINYLLQEHIKYYTAGVGDPSKVKVLVGMSGGVDSSVTAAIMHQVGFKVIGVTLQLSQKETRSCCSKSDIRDAQHVALHMNFKHYILDYSKQFKESVIDNFIEEYSNGRTPSPCVRCNQHIKFGELIKFAKKINADLVVTGHYIKHSYSNNKIQLHKAVDSIKDQTYFMSMIPKENANMMRFPLGIFSKAQVREIAEQLDLIVAKKRESQDLCFIQNGNYRIMLRDIGRSGNICDLDGNVLGYHQGLNNYTVGQKKGINLNNGPWYVIKLVASENKVIVGRQEDLEKVSFRIEEINWITDEVPGELKVKVRAQQEAIECTVHNDIVSLCTPALSISPGQICAFYSGTQLVGGATISSQ